MTDENNPIEETDEFSPSTIDTPPTQVEEEQEDLFVSEEEEDESIPEMPRVPIKMEIAGTDDPEVEDTEPSVKKLDPHVVTMPSSSTELLTNLIAYHKQSMGQTKYDKELKDPSSEVYQLNKCLYHLNENAIHMYHLYRQRGEDSALASSMRFPIGDKKYKIGNTNISQPKASNVKLGGRNAKMFSLSKGKMTEKVDLITSGFYVSIRAISPGDLDYFYNKISGSIETYGSLLGSLFYMYADVEIKRYLTYLLKSCVFESNLNKFDKGDRLLKYLSIYDMYLILLRLLRLMNRDGYPITIKCNNIISPEPVELCDYKEEIIVDLDDIQKTDFSKIPTDEVSFLCSTANKNADEVLRYQKAYVEKCGNTFIANGFKFTLRIPVLMDNILQGDVFNDTLVTTVNDLDKGDSIGRFINANQNRVHIQWIESMTSIEEDGSEGFILDETEPINNLLESMLINNEYGAVVEGIDAFIERSTPHYFGYLSEPCPKCGHLSGDENGYIPFEVIDHFFTSVVRKLTQIS